MSVGNNLKRFRKDKGFSQEQVSKELNISRQSISKWENDVCLPDIENITRLSKYYEVPIDNFLNGYSSDSSVSLKSKDSISPAAEVKLTAAKDEGLMLLAISLICFILTPIGIVIMPIVFKRNKVKNTLYMLVYIVCLLCFIANIFMAYGVIVDLLGLGHTSVQLIK